LLYYIGMKSSILRTIQRFESIMAYPTPCWFVSGSWSRWNGPLSVRNDEAISGKLIVK